MRSAFSSNRRLRTSTTAATARARSRCSRSISGCSASSKAEPTEFLTRRFHDRMWEARAAIALFVGGAPNDLVFTPNATSALNAVIRSVRVTPEEEILTTKHEYGAVLRTLGFIRANVVQVEPEELITNIGIRTRAVVAVRAEGVGLPGATRACARSRCRRQTLPELARRLYEEHRVEIAVYEWDDTTLMRVSIGPYSDEADLERLVEAVRTTLAG